MTVQSHVDGRVVQAPISTLVPDPDQPRKTFSQEGLQVLSASIAKKGILVPLLVRRGEGEALIIHDGERRYRAAQLAELDTVPVIVTGTGDDIRLEQFAMNNLREQLKPMEVARMLADLQRKQFASTNDLAAHMDRAGLPAMTPKQIEDTIALVDLPDWAQDMIDAGQVEVAHACQLQKLAKFPDALQLAREALQEDIAMGGKATEHEVSWAVESAVQQFGIELAIESWRSNPAHFNIKKVCKGCEFKVASRHSSYCMNPAEFERKNAEAKAAGLLPGGKKPPKTDATPADEQRDLEERKEASRADTLQRKAQEYLHRYLGDRIIKHMGDDIDITHELLAWHALGRPGGNSSSQVPLPCYEARKELKVRGLEDLFNTTDMDEARNKAAIQVAHTLAWREVQVVCHTIWGDAIERVWSMDEGFLKLFRKAELLQLVTDHGLELDNDRKWAALKLADLRTEILARADQVTKPKLLQGQYEDLADPWIPWSDRNWPEDLDDDDIEDDGNDD